MYSRMRKWKGILTIPREKRRIRIPEEPVRAQRIPREPRKEQKIPRELRKAETVPRELGKERRIPREPRKEQKIPRGRRRKTQGTPGEYPRKTQGILKELLREEQKILEKLLRRAIRFRRNREVPNIRQRACRRLCLKGRRRLKVNNPLACGFPQSAGQKKWKTVHNLIKSVIDYSNCCCEVTVCFAIKPLTGEKY